MGSKKGVGAVCSDVRLVVMYYTKDLLETALRNTDSFSFSFYKEQEL
jgi:hypothetical protein